MKSLFYSFFPEEYLGRAYKNYDEYLKDLQKKAEISLTNYIQLSFVTDYQAVGLHSMASVKKLTEQLFIKNEAMSESSHTIIRWLGQADFVIESRIEADTNMFFAFDYLCKLYKLDELERFGMTLHLLPYIDKRFEKIFAYLNDDVLKKYPTTDLIIKLYYFSQSSLDIEKYYEIYSRVERRLNKFLLLDGTLDKRSVSFLLSGLKNDIKFNDIECYVAKDVVQLLVREGLAVNITEMVKKQIKYIYLYGENGIGKREIIKRYAQLSDRPVVFVDGKSKHWNTFVLAAREAAINGAGVCIYNADKCEFIQRTVDFLFTTPVFILGEKKSQENIGNSFIRVSIPEITKTESILLWEHYMKKVALSEEVKPFELANKFNFTIAQIKQTAALAELTCTMNPAGINKQQINTCAYMQIEDKMGDLCTLVHADHTWDQLVLKEEQKEMLQTACNHIRFKHIVYDQWGFHKRVAYGRGLSMLFEGPPGTGKTMAAQVVANDLGIDIYKVDLSQVVSKYIGETEKNLGELIDQAKKCNVILFFDETDAILGKRTAVKDSHDKNSNMETSYLLQKMEEYDGITIMTTNYIENIDSAFFRRITHVIHFPFPDTVSRLKIWEGIYPKQTPLEEDIDLAYLANQFIISGGSIKNIAVSSAFMAARDSSNVTMRHIIKAVKYELAKQNKIMLKEDFGEYSFLL